MREPLRDHVLDVDVVDRHAAFDRGIDLAADEEACAGAASKAEQASAASVYVRVRTVIVSSLFGVRSCLLPRHARVCSQACAGCVNLPSRASTSSLSTGKQVADGRDISAFTRVFDALCPATTML